MRSTTSKPAPACQRPTTLDNPGVPLHQIAWTDCAFGSPVRGSEHTSSDSAPTDPDRRWRRDEDAAPCRPVCGRVRQRLVERGGTRTQDRCAAPTNDHRCILAANLHNSLVLPDVPPLAVERDSHTHGLPVLRGPTGTAGTARGGCDLPSPQIHRRADRTSSKRLRHPGNTATCKATARRRMPLKSPRPSGAVYTGPARSTAA